VSASGEVRLVPVSGEQREMLVGASKTRWPELATLVAEWDAAVPGVVDARWAEVRDLAEEARGPRGAPLTALGRIAKIARAAAGGEVAAVCHTSALTGGVEKNDITTGGEAAAERSLSSRGDAVWTVDDLPHLLDEQVERPSVSLRETIEAHDNRVRAYMEEHGWRRAINRMYWTHDDVRPLTFPFRDAIVKQVEREAEEGERDA
jgi:hypothetical protein